MPCSWQLISRSEQTGPVAKKGAAFSPADNSSQLATLGLGNGAMIFLDYQVRVRAATALRWLSQLADTLHNASDVRRLREIIRRSTSKRIRSRRL